MKRLLFLSSLLLILSFAGIQAYGITVAVEDSVRDSKSFQSVGLVLSGGGAKGIAHIGVIKALEENDIPIDYIAGTSMGAIVGGLYAAGYTPDEMMALIESKGFSNWSTGKLDENLICYFLKKKPDPAVINIPLVKGDSIRPASILPTSLISPLPMNFAFMELFSAYTAQCGGDFNKLFVPFRCVASDVYAKHKVVCKSGSLGDAIRASMSFPLVFHPIEIDGTLMYDGGIYDNFPVDVMRSDFAPSVIIGVDVSTPAGTPRANNLMSQLEDMIIQNNDYDLPADEGIKLKINLKEFNLLDFPKCRRIYQIGYEHALAMMDSIKYRIPTRVPAGERKLRREVFKSSTPYLRFDSVTVEGGTENQNTYFMRVFEDNTTDTFGIRRARQDFYRAISGGKLNNLLPTAHFNDSTELFTLNLKASVKNNTSVGFGGYITSSVNSMIFLTANYSRLQKNYWNSYVSGWIGQSYMAAEAMTKLFLSTRIPSSVSFQFATWRMNYNRSENLFYEPIGSTALTDFQIFLRAAYGISTGRNSLADIGVSVGQLTYRYYNDETSMIDNDNRSKSVYKAVQLNALFERNTLNHAMYPSSGSYIKVKGAFLSGEYKNHPAADGLPVMHSRRPWWHFKGSAKNFFRISGIMHLGLESNVLYTTRKLFPYYAQTIATAEEFYPTPSSHNTFNHNFRALSYITAGATPILKMNDYLQIRATAHCFMPFRAIKQGEYGSSRYGEWFADPSVFCEVAGVYTFPFASLSAYCNYSNSKNNRWAAGISFGLFFLAPKFL